MSGSIMNVIYGVPVNDQMLDEMQRIIREGEELPDGGMPRRLSDFMGIEWLYAASGSEIGYVGVKLMERPCHGEMLLDPLRNLEATREQKRRTQECLGELPPSIRDLADKIGHYVLFSDY